jgi:signal peptidase II
MQTDPALSASRAERIRAYWRLLAIGIAVFVADQLSKAWIASRLPFSPVHPAHFRDGLDDIVLVPNFFYLIHVGNTGAAWSLFSGRSVLLAALALATLAAIFVWRRSLSLKERAVQISFGLLCGGIVGNLMDRLRLGHVVDFLDVHFGRNGYTYPTFNVADSGICVGVVIYLLWSLRQPKS